MARAPINGDTLRWAREIARVSRDDLAKTIGVTSERIFEFETNPASRPTFRQLTLMATKLDRPLGFFFAPHPTDPDVPETADFRGQGPDDDLPADLTREMRRAEQHRDAMLDLDSSRRPQLSLQPLTWDNVPQRAAELRRQFGLLDNFVPTENRTNQVFNFWRGLVESQKVLVFQTTGIALRTFRGLSIYHDTLPIILINGGDSASGRTFTLFHEIAHLANRTTGLCVLREGVNQEALANRFAANFLMPRSAVEQSLPTAGNPYEMASSLAARFRVSPLAAAVRLRTLEIIDDDSLLQVRARSDAEWELVRQRQQQSDGFVPPWRLRYRDLGKSYIGAVAQALEDQRVDMMDATYLLNARLPMVEQMLSEYHRTGGTE